MRPETPWMFFDKEPLSVQALETEDEPSQIRRRELARDEWCDQVAALVPSDWRYSFEDDILRTWLWLCPDTQRPQAWTTWLLSNGGIYAAPKGLGLVNVRTPVVGYLEAVTADAAGFIATMLSVSWRHSMFPEGAGGRRLASLTRKLLELSHVHPEALAIRAAID